MELKLSPLPVALALAVALSGCLCFRGSLRGYRCDTDGDCEDGRVCRDVTGGQRYCIVAPGGDGGPDASGDGGADAGTDAGTDAAPVACTNEGGPCDDGMFCTANDTCTGGFCNGEQRDCSASADQCNGAGCDEAADTCVGVPLADDTPCDDGATCSGPDACLAGACTGAPDEAACTAAQICAPAAYPGGSGCGDAAASLTTTCPPAAFAGGTAGCSLQLTTAGDVGVPGEAGRITCTAVPGPVVIFADTFTGGFGTGWTPPTGDTLTTSMDLGQEAATAETDPGFTADLPFSNPGYSVICIDFDVAWQGGDPVGEEVSWSYELDGSGTFTPAFDMVFADFAANPVLLDDARSVCFDVAGAATINLRLAVGRAGQKVFVDNVVVTGLAAARTVPVGGGPDPFADTTQWPTITNTLGAAAVATFPAFGVNSVLYADTTDDDDFTMDRTVDASSCDVLDVDLDFGKDLADAAETLALEVSTGGPFTTVMFLNLDTTMFYPANTLFPWSGLHRVTDLDLSPGGPAARSPSVVFRLHLVASGGGTRFVFADNFTAWCTDLPDPTVGPIVELGGGLYSVEVGATVPETVTLTCTWETTDDGPLSDPAGTVFQ